MNFKYKYALVFSGPGDGTVLPNDGPLHYQVPIKSSQPILSYDTVISKSMNIETYDYVRRVVPVDFFGMVVVAYVPFDWSYKKMICYLVEHHADMFEGSKPEDSEK